MFGTGQSLRAGSVTNFKSSNRPAGRDSNLVRAGMPPEATSAKKGRCILHRPESHLEGEMKECLKLAIAPEWRTADLTAGPLPDSETEADARAIESTDDVVQSRIRIRRGLGRIVIEDIVDLDVGGNVLGQII